MYLLRHIQDMFSLRAKATIFAEPARWQNEWSDRSKRKKCRDLVIRAMKSNNNNNNFIADFERRSAAIGWTNRAFKVIYALPSLRLG